MDKRIVQVGAIPQAADLLQVQRSVEIAIGALAQAVLGTSTLVDGLSCSPAPGQLAVIIGAGSLFQFTPVDQSALGVLPADPAHQTVKVAITQDATAFQLAAPAVAGQQVNILFEGAFAEGDDLPVVLPYYNAANPAQPLSGPGGAGAAQNTRRFERVQIQARYGVPALAGTQATPATDVGWVPLYVVTLDYGDTAVQPDDITVAAGAPFIRTKLTSVAGGGDLAAEAAARIAGDNAEAAARNGAIGAEAVARNDEDQALQGEINSISAALANIRTMQSAAVYTASAIFTCPDGIHLLKVTCVGGGGGGGAGDPSNGGAGGGAGGGAAGAAVGYFGVTPGQQYFVSVGNGGAAGAGGQAAGSQASFGTSGGSSSFSSLCTATGGVGGSGGSTGTAGGPGGQGYGGNFQVKGGMGGDGSPGSLLFGGAGGASFFGGGGRAATQNTSDGAQDGQAWGSGGGGGYAASTTNGGAGRSGIVIVEF